MTIPDVFTCLPVGRGLRGIGGGRGCLEAGIAFAGQFQGLRVALVLCQQQAQMAAGALIFLIVHVHAGQTQTRFRIGGSVEQAVFQLTDQALGVGGTLKRRQSPLRVRCPAHAHVGLP